MQLANQFMHHFEMGFLNSISVYKTMHVFIFKMRIGFQSFHQHFQQSFLLEWVNEFFEIKWSCCGYLFMKIRKFITIIKCRIKSTSRKAFNWPQTTINSAISWWLKMYLEIWNLKHLKLSIKYAKDQRKLVLYFDSQIKLQSFSTSSAY